MSTLTIPVSDRVVARLRQEAAANGTTPEQVAAAELERAPLKSANDPLMRWAGAFQSSVPDAAERHDDYLGEALHEAMSRKAGADDVR